MSAQSGIPCWKGCSHCLHCVCNLCQSSLFLCCMHVAITPPWLCGWYWATAPHLPGHMTLWHPFPCLFLVITLAEAQSLRGCPPPPGFLSVTHMCARYPPILLCPSIPSILSLIHNEFTWFMGPALRFLLQQRFCSIVILLLRSRWGPVHPVWPSSTA
jgi:hypothetical protein